MNQVCIHRKLYDKTISEELKAYTSYVKQICCKLDVKLG